MARRLQLGGREDALALSAIGAAAAISTPFFAGVPASVGLALAGAGGGWMGKRLSENFYERNLIESKLNLASSDVLSQSDNGMLIGYRTDTGNPVYLPYDALSRHGLIQGGSGKGKTVLAKLMMLQQIQRGGGLLFVDAKLDSSDINTIYQFASWCGRAQDVWVINPGDPSESNSYNPILYGDPDEVADRMLALIPASEDNPGADYYRQSTKQGLTTLVSALQAAGMAYNFMDLSILIQNEKALGDLERRMNKHVPHHPATKMLALFLEQYRGGFGKSDQDHNMQAQINIKRLKEVFGGIGSRLHGFGSGGFGDVANSYSPQVKMYEGIRQNKIIVLRLPTMGKPEAAYSFAKMALADFRTAISWLQKLPEDQRPNPVFLALMDEFGSYAMKAMGQPMEQGRSAGVSLWPMFQTYGQLDSVSKEFRQVINATTETKIFFAVNDDVAAEQAAILIGTTNVVKEGISHTNRMSTSTPKVAVAPEGGTSDDASTGISESEEEEYRVTAHDIAKMSRGHCVMLYEGDELFHLSVPMVKVSPDLAKEIGPVRINHVRTPPVQGCDYFNRAHEFISGGKVKKGQGGEEGDGATNGDTAAPDTPTRERRA